MVVGDQDPDHAGTSSRTVVPAPGRDVMASRPPRAVARSSIDVSPSRRPRTAAAPASNPAPSSATVSTSRPAGAELHLDPPGGGVAERVLQRLLGDPEDLAGRLGAQRRRRGDAQLDRLAGDAPQHVDVLAQRLGEPLGLERRRAQLEHHRAQLVHRAARQLLHAPDLLAGGRIAAGEQLARRLGREHDAEQLLGDGVVQLAREPVALLHDAQLAAALVQPGVLDRERGVRGQQRDQALVGVREAVRPGLVGEVERADDAPARHDRHAEERAHVRVRRGPPAAEARVRVDVAGAVGLGRLQHRAEHAVRPRQRAHRGDQLVAHPRRDEAGERALAVRDAERGVARAAQLARGVHEPLEHRLDLALGGEREHDVRERAEGRRVAAAEHAAYGTRRAIAGAPAGGRCVEDVDRERSHDGCSHARSSGSARPARRRA